MPANGMLIATSDGRADALATWARHTLDITGDLLVARDGHQALKALLSGRGLGPAGLPAVALIDLELAGVGAVEVLQQLRSHHRTRHLPVVVMSSARQGHEQLLRQAAALHANAFLLKPEGFGPFRELVIATAMFWTRLNVPPPRVLTGHPTPVP